MSYSPDQRTIVSQILTTAGWVDGTFHILRHAKFVAQLNKEDEFLKITDVSFVGKKQKMPFFALQKDAAVLIVPPPTESDLILDTTEEKEAKHVFCVFEGGVISGTLMIRKGVRISDFLIKQKGFVLLKRCNLRLGDLHEEFFVDEDHPSIIVNSSKILGVTEDEPFS